MYKMYLEHVVAESKEVLNTHKHTHTHTHTHTYTHTHIQSMEYVERIRSQPKVFPMVKAGTI